MSDDWLLLLHPVLLPVVVHLQHDDLHLRGAAGGGRGAGLGVPGVPPGHKLPVRD